MAGDGGVQLPLFVAHFNLKPFVDLELAEVLKRPIWYRPPAGSKGTVPHKGIPAEMLPRICNVWLKAGDAGVLRSAQLIVAANADIITRGLAVVGITALVDEATGFQDARAKDALARILEQFVAKEIQPYLRTFPIDFFKELCRLKKIPFREDMRLPPYFGRLVNSLVYCRLAPGVLAELQRKNPVTEKGICYLDILSFWRFCAAARVFVQKRVLVQSHIIRLCTRTPRIDRVFVKDEEFLRNCRVDRQLS